MAMVASTVANVNRNPKRKPQPWTPDDFLPEEWKSPAEQARTLTDRITSAMMSVGANVVVNPPGTPRRSERRRRAAAAEAARKAQQERAG